MPRTIAGFLLPAFACFAISGTAWAHAHLTWSAPAAESDLAAAPEELTLRFTEAVEPVFCTVVLKDSAGAVIRLDAPRPVMTAGKVNAKALVVRLPKLMVGTYTVVWHVTSVDTHQSDGTFRFTITP